MKQLIENIILDKRVIYDARIPFYEERGSFVYFGTEFYTYLSIIKIEYKNIFNFLIENNISLHIKHLLIKKNIL